jgi:hypothetical protein
MSLHCSIRVGGSLSPDWSDRMGGMSIKTLRSGDYTESLLEGILPDQAALHGVLSTLGDLKFAVLSVHATPENPPAFFNP